MFCIQSGPALKKQCPSSLVRSSINHKEHEVWLDASLQPINETTELVSISTPPLPMQIPHSSGILHEAIDKRIHSILKNDQNRCGPWDVNLKDLYVTTPNKLMHHGRQVRADPQPVPMRVPSHILPTVKEPVKTCIILDCL